MECESLKGSHNDEEVGVEVIGKLTQDFTETMKMKEEITEEYVDDDDDDEEEEEFSFACGIDAPPITADEVFYNGQIRPLFPLFNQNLLLSEEDLEALKEQLPIRPPVKNIFIQTEDNPIHATSSEEIAAGPCCEWSKVHKAIHEDTICKKSNSTGFSKLWRFKDFLHRSNSDGRDTFVFLNHTTTTTTTTAPPAKVEEKVKEKVKKKKKGTVKKSEGVLAHEAYIKSKAKAEGRRSYLPYRPELVGFFTNVNGGLTRNLHPF